jgi:hypothetical protein
LFLDQVGLDKKGATYKKLKMIGLRSARLRQHESKLPNAWTTLYKLASLNVTDFDKVVEAEVLSPFVTAAEINRVLEIAGGRSQIQYVISVSISKIESSDLSSFANELKNCGQKYGIKLNFNQSLNERIENAQKHLVDHIDSDFQEAA